MDLRHIKSTLSLLFLAATLLAASEAKIIVVGGSENWHSGFNYTDWAIKTKPFYVNDTLVFIYDPPSDDSSGYSVYLMSSPWRYTNCDFKKAKLLASPTQGSGGGFSFVLRNRNPYYFASGEDNGTQCSKGMMKFLVIPVRRWPL